MSVFDAFARMAQCCAFSASPAVITSIAASRARRRSCFAPRSTIPTPNIEAVMENSRQPLKKANTGRRLNTTAASAFSRDSCLAGENESPSRTPKQRSCPICVPHQPSLFGTTASLFRSCGLCPLCQLLSGIAESFRHLRQRVAMSSPVATSFVLCRRNKLSVLVPVLRSPADAQLEITHPNAAIGGRENEA